MNFTIQDQQKIGNIIRDYLGSRTVTWIPITYINSWVDYDTNRISAYYKDLLGNVHLMIHCKSGSNAYPFTMPSGYRPDYERIFPIYSTQSIANIIPEVTIETNGTVNFYGYTNTFCMNGEIIYRAA